MESHFDHELKSLKERLLHMGDIAVNMVEIAVTALMSRDVDLAQDVFDLEIIVNRLHIEIDDRCVKMLALHQPMAVDLRLITTVMHINSDLERIGDQAVNVSQTAYFHLFKESPVPETNRLVPRMGDVALKMVRDGLAAFDKKDVELARSVLKLEEEQDQLKAEALHSMISLIGRDPVHSKQFVDIILISKNLERIGDHATNIAEDAIFMVLGKDIRHSSLAASSSGS